MSRVICQINNLKQQLFWLMIATLVFLALSYVYLINNTILNAVARKDALESISSLRAELAVLEGSYASLNNRLTINQAYDLGLVDAERDNTSFAYTDGQGVVSMR